MDTDRGEKEESWLSLLGLRARISLFALVWAEHEQAREERYMVGPKGWVDMMYKARSGESKTREQECSWEEETRQKYISKEMAALNKRSCRLRLCGVSVWKNPCIHNSALKNLCASSTFIQRGHQQGQWLLRSSRTKGLLIHIRLKMKLACQHVSNQG